MDQQNLPSYPGATVLPSSTLAIVSLVSGILGFTFAPVVGGIVALITGYMARNETRATASGDGMATAGIILGWVQIGLGAVAVCCFVAFLLLSMGGAGIYWNNQ